MPRKYTKIELLSNEIFRLKEHSKRHREIGDLYGLTKEQINGFVNRRNRKQRLLKQGCMPGPKGRPRKNAVDESTLLQNELIVLRMQVDVLQNFLCAMEGCDRKGSCC